MGEAAEDLRDERQERGASRDAYYREEAQDRRLDRGIRGERYQDFEREELVDQREDRRQERDIDDQVCLKRTAFLGGAFASEEDRAFRRIVEREVREEKLVQYQELIRQCQDRIREYHTVEDWLDEIRRSDFNADMIEKVRTQAREDRLQFVTRRSQGQLLAERSNWNEEERKVLRNLAELTEFEESAYDDVLLACDNAEPEKLETALETMRFCEIRAGEVLKRIPRLATQQNHKYDNADSLRYVLQFGMTGAKYAAFAAPVMFIGGCLAGDGFAVGTGFSTALFTVMLGAAGGAVFGYFKGKVEGGK